MQSYMEMLTILEHRNQESKGPEQVLANAKKTTWPRQMGKLLRLDDVETTLRKRFAIGVKTGRSQEDMQTAAEDISLSFVC